MFNVNVKFRVFSILATACWVFGCWADVAAAQGQVQRAQDLSVRGAAGTEPYCGVYCLYAAMKLANRDIQFSRLLKPEYVGNRKGSSLDELEAAANNLGMHAMVAQNLTSRVLRQSPDPIILHVKSDLSAQAYDHYVLYVGTENGQAKLYDPLEGQLSLVSFRELAPRCDGKGLIVSSGPINLGAISAAARERLALYALLSATAVFIVHWCRRRWLPRTALVSPKRLIQFSLGQGTLLGVVALSFGVVYHIAADEGLVANADATASIQRAHLANFMPKVSEKKVRRLLGSETETCFIDARFAADFSAGHLRGAISAPVNATDAERRKATAAIAKDARIVVYCQSSGCKYADHVGIQLMDDGFSNISIFRGGWLEWEAQNGNASRRVAQK